MLRNPIQSQTYINIEITHNIIILSLHIRISIIFMDEHMSDNNIIMFIIILGV